MIFLEQFEDFGRGEGADALVHPSNENGTFGLEGFGAGGFEIKSCKFGERTFFGDFFKVRGLLREEKKAF